MKNREHYERKIAICERHIARAKKRLERTDLSGQDRHLTGQIIIYQLDHIEEYKEEIDRLYANR